MISTLNLMNLPNGSLLGFGYSDSTGFMGYGLGQTGIILGRIKNANGWSYLILGDLAVGRLSPATIVKEVRRGSMRLLASQRNVGVLVNP